MPIIALLLATSMLQASSHLTIGDPAPPLRFGGDVSGKPIHSFAAHRPAVIEFWATWCGPCIQNMPHLSDLYTAYGSSADFVGVSVLEQDFTKVAPFVQKMGDKLKYPTAIDTASGDMSKSWLDAAGQNGIPAAFLIDKDGRIAWIGHPQYLEEPLKQVIAGTWDAAAYKKKFELSVANSKEAEKFVQDYYDLLVSAAPEGRGSELIAKMDREKGSYQGSTVPEAMAYTRALFSALAAKEYAKTTELAANPPKNGIVLSYYGPVLLEVQVAAMQGSGDPGWKKLLTDKIDGSNDPNILMSIANGFTSPRSKFKDRDPFIALRAAQKLVKMSRNASFLLTLAWAHFHAGDKAQAIQELDEVTKLADAEKKLNPTFYPELKKSIDEAAKAFKG